MKQCDHFTQRTHVSRIYLERLPMALPVIKFQAGESLFVIIGGRLKRGVTRIIKSEPSLFCVIDFFDHCKYPQAATRLGQIEYRVNARHSSRANIKKARSHQLWSSMYRKGEIFAWYS